MLLLHARTTTYLNRHRMIQGWEIRNKSKDRLPLIIRRMSLSLEVLHPLQSAPPDNLQTKLEQIHKEEE